MDADKKFEDPLTSESESDGQQRGMAPWRWRGVRHSILSTTQQYSHTCTHAHAPSVARD